MLHTPTLAIVVPCYNEEDVLPETSRQLGAVVCKLIKAGKIAEASTIYFVDDGSRDRTWAVIENLVAGNGHVAGIKLSRNRGHQNAVLAGLFTAQGDAIISIDSDLQDDVGAISEMVDRFR